MTLGEHLGELRRRLVICISAVAVGAIITYVLYDQILAVLQSPYCQAVTHTSRPAGALSMSLSPCRDSPCASTCRPTAGS